MKDEQEQSSMSARSASTAAAAPSNVLLTLALCLSVAVAGACVMVIELVGTRVLSPVFGSSVYVWTSQITVALLSLTLGYPAGGAIADRAPRPAVFFGINALSGLAVLITMLIRGPVLHAAMSWESRLGTLASSLTLFTLPLFLLGMVGPFAARLFVRDMRRVGFTIGKLSALSAFGSIFGSVATGFWLIPHVSINHTLLSVAGVMTLIGVAGLLLTRSHAAAGGSALAALLLTLGVNPLAGRAPLSVPGVKVLFEGSSAYGDVKVVDLPLARFMYIGQMIQTVDCPTRHIETLHDLAYFIPAMRPETKRVLLVGLAGGTKVKMLNKLGIAVDSVEIDPLVVEKARDSFGIVESELSRIFIEDGRPYLNRCTQRYDAVIMDVFGGGVAPSHLFSVEALAAIKKCLNPGGLLMMNCLRSSQDPADRLLMDVLYTIDQSKLFAHRRTFAWDPRPTDTIDNYLTFASDRPLVFAKPLEQVIPADLSARILPKAKEVTVSLEGARMITDDLNPLDVLQIGHNEKLRRIALASDLKELFDPRR
jgi:predicted membrane-bound spermidine synthase